MRKPLLGLLGVGLVSLVLLPRPAAPDARREVGHGLGRRRRLGRRGWHGGSAFGDDGSWHARRRPEGG